MSIVQIPYAKKILADMKLYPLHSSLAEGSKYKKALYYIHMANWDNKFNTEVKLWKTIRWHISTQYGWLMVSIDNIPIYTTKLKNEFIMKIIDAIRNPKIYYDILARYSLQQPSAPQESSQPPRARPLLSTPASSSHSRRNSQSSRGSSRARKRGSECRSPGGHAKKFK